MQRPKFAEENKRYYVERSLGNYEDNVRYVIRNALGKRGVQELFCAQAVHITEIFRSIHANNIPGVMQSMEALTQCNSTLVSILGTLDTDPSYRKAVTRTIFNRPRCASRLAVALMHDVNDNNIATCINDYTRESHYAKTFLTALLNEEHLRESLRLRWAAWDQSMLAGVRALANDDKRAFYDHSRSASNIGNAIGYVLVQGLKDRKQ